MLRLCVKLFKKKDGAEARTTTNPDGNIVNKQDAEERHMSDKQDDEESHITEKQDAQESHISRM